MACEFFSTAADGACHSLPSVSCCIQYRLMQYRRCVQATKTSGVGCSNAPGDTKFHIFSLLFNGEAVGDSNRTRFRFDFVQQPLSFASGSSQSSTTGTTQRIVQTRHVFNTTTAGEFARLQIGGETQNNSPHHLNGDVAEIAVFTSSPSQVLYFGLQLTA
jgi:hypothetical protein